MMRYAEDAADELITAARQSDVLGFYDQLCDMAQGATDEQIQTVATCLARMPPRVLEMIPERLEYSAIGVPGIRVVPVLQVLRDHGLEIKSFHTAHRAYKLRAAILDAARAVAPDCVVNEKAEGVAIRSLHAIQMFGVIAREMGIVAALDVDGAGISVTKKDLCQAAEIFRPIRLYANTLAVSAFKGQEADNELVAHALVTYGHVVKADPGPYQALSFGEFADRIERVYDATENPRNRAVVGHLRRLDEAHKVFGWAAEDWCADREIAKRAKTARPMSM